MCGRDGTYCSHSLFRHAQGVCIGMIAVEGPAGCQLSRFDRASLCSSEDLFVAAHTFKASVSSMFHCELLINSTLVKPIGDSCSQGVVGIVSFDA